MERSDRETETFADVIIDISHEALDRVFQYRVPFSLRETVRPGVRVAVPFGAGNRQTEGYVVALSNVPSYDPDKIKSVARVVPGSMTVESQLILVADFLKKRYGSSMIKALKTVMPVKTRVRPKEETTLSLNVDRAQAEALLEAWTARHYTARVRFMSRLLDEGTLSKDQAVKTCQFPLKEIKKLRDQGIIRMENRTAYRDPFSQFQQKKERPVLTAEQRTAVDTFCGDYAAGIRKTYLLYGVTGSGKTEVYLNLIEQVLNEKKQAIVLIPEISLTYQTVRRFYERFGGRIAVLHSRMSQGERCDAVERARQGDADVMIGPRSALFAPFQDLGLIIMDEEHDSAYKSDNTPKYHARETAVFRAKLAGASVVLGSATPSTESFYLAKKGEYTLLTLRRRAGGALLPSVTCVDLREEFRRGNRSIFSGALREKIEQRLERKEQIMLFLNRRGFAGFVSCRNCGTVIHCPHCEVSLTYHKSGVLRCHYCGYETTFSPICPTCGQPHVAAFGLGTEKAEAALYKEFPGIRVLRMDTDTTRRKDAHQKLLTSFSRGEADVLLGTQMIVKGHDYSNVTLVGILAADLSLHSQDFRSGERTFQLLAQAAGRAGRGKKAGEVVIQTYSPRHYAVTAAMHHAYEEFYEQEITYRALMEYPPCAHMMVLLLQSREESAAARAADLARERIAKREETAPDPIRVLNPNRAAIAKLKDMYRQVLYLKHEDAGRLEALKEYLESLFETGPDFAGVSVQFDFDPMGLY